SARLQGISARARAALAAHPSGDAARRQDSAARLAERRRSGGADGVAAKAQGSGRGGSIRRSGPAPGPDPSEGRARMNLELMTQQSGEWLRGAGPEADIVVSSRIRLARNLSSYPFANRASAHQKAEIEHSLRDRLAKLDFDTKLHYLNLA